MGVFNRDMLQLARAARGFTQADVARASGVTQALISRIENGLDQPSEEVLAALAGALRLPVAFFHQESRSFGLPQYHYRKRAKLSARLLQKIEADINLWRIHIEKMIKSFDRINRDGLPTIDLDAKQWTAQEAARHMRGLWMVPRGPIINLTSIVEDAGVVIVPLDFSTHLLDALSFRIPGLPPLVFINKEVPGDRYRFTLAHEIAHLLLHNHPLDDDEMESEADRFAAEFLMPASEVRPHLKHPSIGKMARVKTHWKVSIKSLIYNAHQLKVITPSQYRGLMVNYSKAGYSRGEPYPIEIEKPRLLSEMVQYHMNELGYSTEDMANLLLLGADEFLDRYTEKPRIRLVSSN